MQTVQSFLDAIRQEIDISVALKSGASTVHVESDL